MFREISLYIINALIVAVIILQLIHRKKLGPHIWLITAALAVTVLTEAVGTYYIKSGETNNHIVYNIGNGLIVFLLIFIYYWKIMNSRARKSIQLGFVGVFLLNYFLSVVLMEDFLTQFVIQSYFVQILLLLASICLYFYEVFNSDKVLSIRKYYSFWVSISFSIIYFGLLPVVLIGTSGNENLSKGLLFSILLAVNLIGYSVLLMGIFYSKENTVDK